MKTKDNGCFASKHPGAALDERIAAAVRGALSNGAITCPTAESVAAQLGVTLAAVGETADLLEARLTECQLGLFGHAGEAPHGRIAAPAATLDPALAQAVRGALRDGRLPCAAAWAIAARLGATRLDVANVCETLHIKVSCCQLGAF